MPTQKRVKKTIHQQSLAEFIRKHSPIKRGLKINDEDRLLEKYNKNSCDCRDYCTCDTESEESEEYDSY